MARLTLCLLGAFQAAVNGEPITAFATDKSRALLAYLAVEMDRPHRRDTLAGLLWPDQPERKARHNLRQALSHLRQAIADQDDAAQPILLVSRDAIQFNPYCDHWLDATAFANLVETSRAHRHRRVETCRICVARLEEAVALYQGGFLEQFFLGDSPLFEEWALLHRERLHQQVVEALSCLVDHYQPRVEFAQAGRYARRQLALEPWREEAHRTLMRLLALQGQRSAALAQYETCRQVLDGELGVEPAQETRVLYERIRAGEALPFSPPAHRLPPSPTPFVGRQEGLADLGALLADPDCRLLTLVGPGGIGKTRLALQAAGAQRGAFADGIYFVPLASVSAAEFLLPTLADVLAFPFQDRQDPQRQLLNYLREKEMLLLLDNMEHLLGGAGLLVEILQRAPGILLLVTSRERLHLQEERVYEVTGLTCPTDDALEGLEECSAIELFLQTAQRVRGAFVPSEAETSALVRICRLVEGMPLGIELAAAWVAVRPLDEIAREMQDNLATVSSYLRNVPERHRSMWATFEYSWRLLSEQERRVLARLSVFRGGFGGQAAAAVAGATPTMLLALLGKSLIRRAPSDRFDMHGLLRQCAAVKLEADRSELDRTRAQHASLFATFLEGQEVRLIGAEQEQALREIASEIENVRQAWRWSVARGNVQLVAQGLKSLYHFLNVRCRYQEAIDLFAQVIEAWGEDGGRESVMAQVLARQGAFYRRLGQFGPALAALEKSLGFLERLEMPSEQVFCLINLADVRRGQGAYHETERLAQMSLDLSREIGDPWGEARSLFLLGMAHYRTGDLDRAEARGQESLAIGRASGNQRLIMSALNMLADVACHRGDFLTARRVFEECLALSRGLDDPFNVAVHLNNLGTVVHQLGEGTEARPYYRESLEICREIGDRQGQAIALSNLGEVAYEIGDYEQALAFYQEGLVIGRSLQHQRAIIVCLNNLGQTACALEDWEAARAYLAEGLRIATEIQELPVQFQILVNLAELLAKQGQAGRAARLLGLVRGHPVSDQWTQERAAQLAEEMGLTLPLVDATALGSVVTEMLNELI